MLTLIGVAILVAAAAFSIVAFRRSSKLLRASYVTPLLDGAPNTPVKFDAAGVYSVYIEVTHKEHFLRPWRYLLWDGTAGAYIESRWASNRRYPGTTGIRWRTRYFDVPHPGDYQLVIDGLEAGDRMKIILGRYDFTPDAWQSAAIVALLLAVFAAAGTVIGIAGR